MTEVPSEPLEREVRRLRALARRLARDDDEADDLVHDVWLDVSSAPTLPPPGADRQRWLSRVLRNRARMRWRAGARRERRERSSALLPSAPASPEHSPVSLCQAGCRAIPPTRGTERGDWWAAIRTPPALRANAGRADVLRGSEGLASTSSLTGGRALQIQAPHGEGSFARTFERLDRFTFAMAPPNEHPEVVAGVGVAARAAVFEHVEHP